MSESKQRITARAYEIWEQRGRPHGEDIEHWLQAQRELAGEGGDVPSPRVPRRKNAGKRPPRAATSDGSAPRGASGAKAKMSGA